jgi:MFS family permease
VAAAGSVSTRGARDLALLAGGMAVSAAGDSAALIALLLRLRPEGSGWVAALLAAQLVPVVLLSAFVGQLVDKIETRRVLLVAVCGQALVAIPLALVTGPAITVALFLVLGGFNATVRPAINALVPSIVGEERTTTGFSRVALGQGVGFIVGPALGGLLTGVFSARTALLADAGTFVVMAAACFLLSVRREPAAHAEGEHLSRAEEARLGFRVLGRDRVLRLTLAVTAISIACATVDNVAGPFRFVDQLGTTATGYGVYLSIWGVGMLAGAQIAPRVPVAHERFSPIWGNLLCSLGIVGIGVAPSLLAAYVAAAAGGVGNGMENVAQNALIGKRVPEHQRGRAFAASMGVIQTAIVTGTVLAGPLISALDPGTAMALAGGLGSAVALGGVFALRTP